MHFDSQGHSASGGIYQIKNTKTGKVYIGSAGKFSVRWTQHQRSFEKGRHGNKHMQSAYNLDGPSVWHFTVLEVVVGDKIARKAAEQVWIDKFYGENCYNFMKKAAPSREDVPDKNPDATFKKRSESSKKMWQDSEYRKMQLAILLSSDNKTKAKNANKAWRNSQEGIRECSEAGKKLGRFNIAKPKTEETKAKISAALKGREGRPCTEEAKAKISQANKGREKSSELRALISANQKGRKLSKETKAKQSLAMKGKKRTPEHQAKLSESRKKNNKERKEKQVVEFSLPSTVDCSL